MQFSKAFQGLPQDRIEEAFDRFAREEFHQGHQIVKEGEPISKMYIVKMGELQCTRNGQPVTAIQEAGGFSYFGEQAVLANEPSPVTITVQSESCLLLGASRRALVQLMGQGPAVMGISADDAALASSALKATAVLQDLNDTEIKVSEVLMSCLELQPDACAVPLIRCISGAHVRAKHGSSLALCQFLVSRLCVCALIIQDLSWDVYCLMIVTASWHVGKLTSQKLTGAPLRCHSTVSVALSFPLCD